MMMITKVHPAKALSCHPTRKKIEAKSRTFQISKSKVRLEIIQSPTSLAPRVPRELLRVVIIGAYSILDTTNVATV